MGYQLGDEFPREGFVQAAIEQHFGACERVEAGWADLACVDENGLRWVIEAKGETSDTGLDFRTGLGQLLQGMQGPEARYALAMPDTLKFARQRERVSGRVRTALGLNWILVDEHGAVTIVAPRTR
jgi:hypothetical protein